MALLARTFRTAVGLPWSTLKLLDRAMRWSAMPMVLEVPISEVWAEDLFLPCSTKCSLACCTNDDLTDSSGSEICDDEDDDEWSSDSDSDDYSDTEEELDGFSFGSDGEVDFWGDRWFWTTGLEDDEGGVHDVETSSYGVERLVEYAMPSMDPNTDAAADAWIEKYGSSRSQMRFVTMSRTDSSENISLVLPSTSAGLFVAVL